MTTAFEFPPPPVPSIAIDGRVQRFPVRRIFCVGRNYADHAREMGGAPEREPPFFFMKPSDAVVESGACIAYPPETVDLHYEVELVAAIGVEGFNVSTEAGLRLIYGYAVGIDLTRRDLQKTLREAGRPWDWAKGFDHSAPCGPIRRVEEIGDLASGSISLTVNGTVRQHGDLADMIWSVGQILSTISRSMILKPGDIVFTGTPSGVGAIQVGDELVGRVDGLAPVMLQIGPPPTAS
jgi:fumarylpyruvate hydrolase